MRACTPASLSLPSRALLQMDAILAFYTGPGLLGSLRSSTSQLLLLGGAQDAVVPPATQAQAATNMVAASLQEVPDAGHVSGAAACLRCAAAGECLRGSRLVVSCDGACCHVASHQGVLPYGRSGCGRCSGPDCP